VTGWLWLRKIMSQADNYALLMQWYARCRIHMLCNVTLIGLIAI
jgi:hypothetical protein